MNSKMIFTVFAFIGLAFGMSQAPQPVTESSYIIQGSSLADVRALVVRQGGEITHELGVIRAVGATLTPAQVKALRAHAGIQRVYDNGAVEVAGKPVKNDDSGSGRGNSDVLETHYPTQAGAKDVHGMGFDGSGVTIAVLDTGLWKHEGIRYNSVGGERIKAVYNAITDSVPVSPLSGDDPGGHGTHVASIAVSSRVTAEGNYNGVAPGASLVSVQAFDEHGLGSYANVIRAIDWVVANKEVHGIRVLNLSFSAEPRSYYWDDPINQAVMAAWQQDIVVVAAAGNRGPAPMTIGVPGNVPYVITVGAVTDNYTPYDYRDDELASFSSTGPTVEGFVKPEVLAPGGHVLGLMDPTSTLAKEHPNFYVDQRYYFEMSGTSQASAVVSGVAALILQADPTLSADDVKCRIMSAGRVAMAGKGGNKSLAYSVYQQGAGMVDVKTAIANQARDCANGGLDIAADIAGTKHFGGPANQQDDGSYYLRGNLDSRETGYVWDGSYTDSSGYLWTKGYLWTDGYLWTNSYLWTDSEVGLNGYLWTDGYLWTNGYLWTDGYLWSNGYLWTNALTEMASMSSWVEQE